MTKFKFVFSFTLFLLVNCLQSASILRDDEQDYKDLLGDIETSLQNIPELVHESKYTENKKIASKEFYTEETITNHKNKISETNPVFEDGEQCITKAGEDTVAVTKRYTSCETSADENYNNFKIDVDKKKKELTDLKTNLENDYDDCDVDTNPNCIKDLTSQYKESFEGIKSEIDDLSKREANILEGMKNCYGKKFEEEASTIITTLKNCIKENADKHYNNLLQVAGNSKEKLANIKTIMDNFPTEKEGIKQEVYTDDEINDHNQKINEVQIKYCTDKAKESTEEVLKRYRGCEGRANSKLEDFKLIFEKNNPEVNKIIEGMTESYKKCNDDDKFPSCIKTIITAHDNVQEILQEVTLLETDVNNLLPDLEICYGTKFDNESKPILAALGICEKEEPYIKLLDSAKNLLETINENIDYLENKYPNEKQDASDVYYTATDVQKHKDDIKNANDNLQTSKAKPCIETANSDTEAVTKRYSKCEEKADITQNSMKSSYESSKLQINEIIKNMEKEHAACLPNVTPNCIDAIVQKYKTDVQTQITAGTEADKNLNKLLPDMKICFGDKFKTEASKIITKLNACIKEKSLEEITELQTKCGNIITTIETEESYLEETYDEEKNDIISKFDTRITTHNKKIESINGEINADTNAVLCYPKVVHQTSEQINGFKNQVSETNSKSNIAKIYISLSKIMISSFKEKIEACLAENKKSGDCITDSLGYTQKIGQVENDIKAQSFEKILKALENTLPNEQNLEAIINSFKDCNKKLAEGTPDPKLKDIKEAIEMLENIPTQINFFEGYNDVINNILAQYDIPKAVEDLLTEITKKGNEAKTEDAKSCIKDAKSETEKAKVNSEKAQNACVTETDKTTDKIRKDGLKILSKVEADLRTDIDAQKACFTGSVDKLVTCLGGLDKNKISEKYKPVNEELSKATTHRTTFKSCLDESFIKKDTITTKLEKCIKDKNSASNIYANSILYFCSAVLLLIRMI